MHVTLRLILLAVLFAPSSLRADPHREHHPPTIKTLIVDGFSNHNWQATTREITTILEKDGAFEITVSTVPKQDHATWTQWNPEFDRYDVVIQNTNDITQQGAWPEPARRSLERYVANGGGLFAFHSANNAFPDWPAYNQMIGLGWRERDFGPAIVIQDGHEVRIPAGEGEKTGHGKRTDAPITRLGDHPIHRGLPRVWRAADVEVYRYARGPAEHLTVLSYANDVKTGLNFPTEWVVTYGQGRVYTSTFGHYRRNRSTVPPGIRCRGFQTLLPRAARWLSDTEVPAAVPDDFPTKDRTSLEAAPEPEP